MNFKLFWRQISFTLVATHVTEQAGSGYIGSSVAAAVLSCTQVFSCALKMASLFDGDFMFDSEICKV